MINTSLDFCPKKQRSHHLPKELYDLTIWNSWRLGVILLIMKGLSGGHEGLSGGYEGLSRESGYFSAQRPIMCLFRLSSSQHRTTASSIRPLQLIQNAAAQNVSLHRCCIHSTSYSCPHRYKAKNGPASTYLKTRLELPSLKTCVKTFSSLPVWTAESPAVLKSGLKTCLCKTLKLPLNLHH